MTDTVWKVGCYRINPSTPSGQKFFILHMLVLPLIPITALVIQVNNRYYTIINYQWSIIYPELGHHEHAARLPGPGLHYQAGGDIYYEWSILRQKQKYENCVWSVYFLFGPSLLTHFHLFTDFPFWLSVTHGLRRQVRGAMEIALFIQNLQEIINDDNYQLIIMMIINDDNYYLLIMIMLGRRSGRRWRCSSSPSSQQGPGNNTISGI